MAALEPRDAEVTEAGSAAGTQAGSGTGTPHGAAADVRVARVEDRGEGAVDSVSSVLSRSYLALSLGLVSVIFLIAFEATAVGTAMPVAARELHGVSLYAFAFSGFFTTSLFGMVLSGQWADRQGPLAPLGSGICAFAVGLVLAGTAGSMWQFIMGRAVQGLGGGLVIVALYVVVGRAYPERLRPSMMAGFAAGWVVPSVVGPLAAGAVTERLGWRWVFLGIPVLVVIPLVLALPQIRRRASGPARRSSGDDESDAGAAGASTDGAAAARADRRRIHKALGVSLGAGLLQYAAQDVAWISLVPLAVGLALLVPSVLGLMPRGTYRAVRGLPSVILLRGVSAGSFISAESFIPLMLVTQRGLSPTLAGLSLALGGATWSLGSFVQSRPRMHPYRERLAMVGMLLVASAIALAPSVLIDAVPVWIVAVDWAFGCFGMGLVIAATSVLLLKLSAPHEAGSNSAALQISDALSNVLLLAVGGAAFAALGGGAVGAADATSTTGSAASAVTGAHPAAFTAVFLPMAVVALVGAWVATRLRGQSRT